MKKLWFKIRMWIKVLKIIIEDFFYKIVHRLKGERLSKQGAGLRDYAYYALLNPDNPIINPTYEEKMYEEMIKEVMETNNYSRTQALTQVFLVLSTYDDYEEDNTNV